MSSHFLFTFLKAEMVNSVHCQYRACLHRNYLPLYWKFLMRRIQPQSKSDWLFNTQSSVLQADWSILENNEKAT